RSRPRRDPGAARSSGLPRCGQQRRRQLLDVLGQHVHLEVHPVADGPAAQGGAGEGLGDEPDRDLVAVDRGDGEAHAVHGEGALGHDVAGQATRQGEAQQGGAGVLLAPDDLADPVDVALHDVAVEAAVGPHAALEVHGVAGGEVPEGGRGEGGGDDVGAPVLALDRSDGQAAAADGDRVAEGDALQDVRGADPQAGGVRTRAERVDGAELFDDAGEHGGPSWSGGAPGVEGEAEVGGPARRGQRGDVDEVEVETVREGGDREVLDGGAAIAQQRRGEVDDQLVHQVRTQEGGGDDRPALDQHVPDAAVEQLGQGG